MFDGPGVIEKIGVSKITNNVASVKNTKEAIEDENKQGAAAGAPELTQDDKDTMAESQNTANDVATDSQKANDAISKGSGNATAEEPGFDELPFGC
jgi:hypothetical protein